MIASSLVARLVDLTVALPIVLLVVAETGSYAWAGAASGALVAGAAVATPVLGRLADARGYRPVLGTAAAASAVVLASLAVLAPWLGPAALVVLAGLAGLSSPPIEASVRAILARAAGPGVRQRLLTADATAQELVFMAGPPLHVGVATLASPRAAVALCAAVLIAGTTVLLSSPATAGRAPARALAPGSAIARPAVRWLVAVGLMAGVFFGTMNIALVARADEAGATWLAGVFHALWAAGSLAAGLLVVLRPWRAPVARRLILLTTAAAVAALPLVLAGPLWLLGALLVLQGMTIAPAIAAHAEAIADAAPQGRATEAFAWAASLTALGLAAGELVGGLAVETVGAGGALVAGAAAMALAAALTPLAVRPRAVAVAAAVAGPARSRAAACPAD